MSIDPGPVESVHERDVERQLPRDVSSDDAWEPVTTSVAELREKRNELTAVQSDLEALILNINSNRTASRAELHGYTLRLAQAVNRLAKLI